MFVSLSDWLGREGGEKMVEPAIFSPGPPNSNPPIWRENIGEYRWLIVITIRIKFCYKISCKLKLQP